jgi:hypothetical protein
MGFIFRKNVRLGKTARLNVSKSGVSATKRFGPITVNTRGQVRIRLGKGLSYRIF